MSAERDDLKQDLSRRIEAIETGYEFLLAYAAQGRDTDRGAGSGRRLREFLDGMQAGLDGLAGLVGELLAQRGAETAAAAAAFLEAVARDALTARSALRLVAVQQDISSQLVDNLNASIHLRAVLTDLFIVDELLKRPQPPQE